MRTLSYLKNVTTLELNGNKCNGCGICTKVCPHAVISLKARKANIGDRDACMECGACAKNCPEEALSVRSGVGCAYAVINGFFGRDSACCC